MRLFVAVSIPEELRNKAAELGKGMRTNSRTLTFVKPQSMHLTLKFLGEVDGKTLEEVLGRLKVIQFERFTCTLSSVSAFPNENYVRVVWVGAQSDGKLDLLAKKVNDILGGFGSEKDEKFTPHLTLARVKQRVDMHEFIAKHKNVNLGSFEVSEFSLIESRLKPEGPEYHEVMKFKAR